MVSFPTVHVFNRTIGYGRPLSLTPLTDRHSVFFCIAAALGALLGQRHVDDLIGLLIGNWAMGLGTVILAALAAGLLGIVFGRPFRKGSGLAFLCSCDVLQQSFE